MVIPEECCTKTCSNNLFPSLFLLTCISPYFLDGFSHRLHHLTLFNKVIQISLQLILLIAMSLFESLAMFYVLEGKYANTFLTKVTFVTNSYCDILFFFFFFFFTIDTALLEYRWRTKRNEEKDKT